MIVKKNIDKVFLVFLLTHIIIWTLIPSFSNLNLPLDTIEALAWGSNLDWGFNKHPPLSALAVEIVYQIFGNKHLIKMIEVFEAEAEVNCITLRFEFIIAFLFLAFINKP